MKVYVVIRNDEVDEVFSTHQTAKEHVKKRGGWNLWRIVERELND